MGYTVEDLLLHHGSCGQCGKWVECIELCYISQGETWGDSWCLKCINKFLSTNPSPEGQCSICSCSAELTAIQYDYECQDDYRNAGNYLILVCGSCVRHAFILYIEREN